MTSTDYLPRHADEASFMPIPESRAAYDLLTRAGATSDRAELARWRRDAFELLMKVNPTKRGRHHAHEADAQVDLMDKLLALRGEYLTSRTSAATVIELDWDLRAIGYLSALACWA